MMQRKAAGDLRAVSGNQSQKIGCRSAVFRVDGQSTRDSPLEPRFRRTKPVCQHRSDGNPERLIVHLYARVELVGRAMARSTLGRCTVTVQSTRWPSRSVDMSMPCVLRLMA